MASIDRYRPARESYQPPSLPPKPPPPADRLSRSPTRRHVVPPAVPSPPTLSSRTSPPRPVSRRLVPPSPAHVAQQSPARPAPKPRPSQWFFTPDEILSSPSIIDGLRPAEERFRRAKGVNFIYQAGIMLQLPQITLYVASVFFHRFFMRVSLVEEKNGVHHYNIAATSLFLANKTQEDCRKTKDLIISVARVAQKNSNLIIDEQSKEYWRWRDSILMYEEIMLELLTFDLMVDNPYQTLYDYLKRLDLHRREQQLRDSAWAYCNDSCFTTLPLLMSHTDIAASALFFAAASTRSTIEDVGGEPWWRYLRADEDRIIKAIDVMSAFYSENPLQKKDDRYQGSPVFTLESTRRRGVYPAPILSQAQPQRSEPGTPLIGGGGRGTEIRDAASPSPLPARPRTNGQADHDDVIKKESNGTTSASTETPARSLQRDRGDSDATLKAAANDLDRHHANIGGGGLVSPQIKRAPDQDFVEAERVSKRPRVATDEDEGEVRESP